MSKRIEIVMVRMYRIIDNDTDKLEFETLDYGEAMEKAEIPYEYRPSDWI